MECGQQRSKVKTLLLQRCSLRWFHVTDSQNTRDQITRGRRLKRAWSNCVLCIPHILGGSQNECWLHICDACVITTWRLGLRAPLVAHNCRIDHIVFAFDHSMLFLQGGQICWFDFTQMLPSWFYSGTATFGDLGTVELSRHNNSLIGRPIPGMCWDVYTTK